MRRTVGKVFDVVSEAFAALGSRKSRSALTALGIAIGVTTLTAMLGITSSSSASISGEFDAFKATRVTVSGATVDSFEQFVGDAGLERAAGIRGVSSLGASYTVGDRSVPASVAANLPPVDAPTVATRGELLNAEGAEILSGRIFDEGNETRRDDVAVIGNIFARRLGIQEVGTQLVFLDGRPFTIVGIVGTSDLSSAMPFSVYIPYSSAIGAGWGTQLQAPAVVMRTDIGAAEVVGSQAVTALDPRDQAGLDAAVPPRPSRLQDAVERQTRVQLLALAGVSLIVGAIGVSNTTLVGVMERRHEIGVRKAVGATTGDVVAQFLVESFVLGTLGGLLGEIIGVVVTLIASIINGWPPIVPAWLYIAGPMIGGGVGLLAGAYPAFRASRVDPIVTLT